MYGSVIKRLKARRPASGLPPETRREVRDDYRESILDGDLPTRMATLLARAAAEAADLGGELLNLGWRADTQKVEDDRHQGSYVQLARILSASQPDGRAYKSGWMSDTRDDDGLFDVHPYDGVWWSVRSQTMGMGSTDVGLITVHPGGWTVQGISGWCADTRFVIAREEVRRG